MAVYMWVGRVCACVCACVCVRVCGREKNVIVSVSVKVGEIVCVCV